MMDFCLAKGSVLRDIISDNLLIKNWKNEVETENCALINYDTFQIFVCYDWGKDDRYINAIQKRWNGWSVSRQNEGVVFHFKYAKRDFSAIEFTDEMFDEKNKELKLFEFIEKEDELQK